MTTVTMRVNGETRSTSVAPETTLLELLRDHLSLTGAKVGCDVGDCGACTVIVNGKYMTSGSLTGSFENLLGVIDQLIALERKPVAAAE